MKCPIIPALLIFYFFISANSSAQITAESQARIPLRQQPEEKPALFSNLSDSIECNVSSLEKLFEENDHFSFEGSSHFVFHGKKIANIKHSSNAQNINITLDEYPEAMFSLSRISKNNVTRYRGHIISIKHGDAFVLSYINGKYYLIKQQQRLVMAE